MTKICIVQNLLTKPHLPLCDLGQCKYRCSRIFVTQLELKQNVIENKSIERESLRIEPHVSFITIKSHCFSGAPFDDNFFTFGVASCIMVHDPIFARLCFAWFHAEIILPINKRC